MGKVFETKNPEGNTVYCSTEQWDHATRHEIMAQNLPAVRDTIQDPDIIFESSQYETRSVYFKKSNLSTYAHHTKVVTELVGLNSQEVVTAFPSLEVKGGIGDVKYTK